MPLFNTLQPVTPQAAKPRPFTGSAWDKLALNATGQKTDGSANALGKGVSDVLPVAAGLVSLYFTGSYNLGSSLGNAAVSGLEKVGDNMLDGTDSQAVARAENQREAKTRGLLSGIGNAAGGLYSAIGGADGGKLGSEDGKAFRKDSILDKMFSGEDRQARNSLRGVSSQGISDYLKDDYTSGFGSFGQTSSSLSDGIEMLAGPKKTRRNTTESSLPYNLFVEGGESVKTSNHNQHQMKTSIKSPFVFGSKLSSTKKFEEGGESVPGLLSIGDINTIRETYQLDTNDAVNRVTAGRILESGRTGMIPHISKSHFFTLGTDSPSLAAQLNPIGSKFGMGNVFGAADAKVTLSSRVGGHYTSLPSIDDTLGNKLSTKMVAVDPISQFNFGKTDKARKSLSPFVFFREGGEGVKSGNGKK